MKNNHHELIDIALEFLKQIKIDSPLMCDHICYRTTSNEDYIRLKVNLSKSEVFVHEALVRGRKISIFRFSKPLTYKGLVINSLELPAPKTNNKYKEGYEHLEFVVVDLAKLIQDNPSQEWDISGMKRELNPELALSLDENYQVKFHPLDILEVVEIEKSLGISEV